MPRSGEGGADGGLGELVVGAAGDDPGSQSGKGVGVDRTAQGAWCEDVGRGVEDRVGGDHPRARPGGDGAHRGLVHVGDHQVSACGRQLVGEVGADVADALQGHGDAGEIPAEHPANAQFDPPPHALGGDRAGVARGGRMTLQTGDEAGCPARMGEVGGRDADVLRRPVTAAEHLDGASERLEQAAGLGRAGIADDHRLAPAEVEVGDGVLERHRPGQAQRVVDPPPVR